MEAKRCCFCNKVIKGLGNNPAPINNDEDAECCDECNWNIIVPARIEEQARRKHENE